MNIQNQDGKCFEYVISKYYMKKICGKPLPLQENKLRIVGLRFGARISSRGNRISEPHISPYQHHVAY